MSAASTRRISRTSTYPGYLCHETFMHPAAWRMYDPAVTGVPDPYADGYMPDEVTRDRAKRMHYAAYRLRGARTADQRTKWRSAYVALRDAIVLGNRKLVYRAVRRRMAISNYAEDMIGDCQIVLIQAVAAFDPWLGVRFSTYAYTCLIRAISRTSQKLSRDDIARAVSFDVFPEGEPCSPFELDRGGSSQIPIDEFLRDDHPLLSPREKAIIACRFCLDDSRIQTLETVGRSLGLSKERVRQVQESALTKLRRALGAPAPHSKDDQ